MRAPPPLLSATTQPMAAPSDLRVVVNVGGSRFETRLRTLSRIRELAHYDAQSEEHFIDRDPTHFRHILNCLRNTPTFPSSIEELEALHEEAKYYKLHDFCASIFERLRAAKVSSIEYYLSVIAERV